MGTKKTATEQRWREQAEAFKRQAEAALRQRAGKAIAQGAPARDRIQYQRRGVVAGTVATEVANLRNVPGRPGTHRRRPQLPP